MYSSKWLCCQIGARENYAIPKALNEYHLLAGLFTDIWIDAASPVSGLMECLVPRLSGRHAKIEISKISSFNASAILFEFQESISRHQGWQRMYHRNLWFQDKVIHSGQFKDLCRKENNKPVVFCYSYAARKILERAKYYGCYTVLGQIDGGLEEENLVAHAVTSYSKYQPVFERAPEAYWEDWKVECNLADRIVVNSDWSRQLLNKAGVPDSKLRVVPLMYDTNSTSAGKIYPDRFTDAQPMKVLFLGSLIIRKGIGAMLEAVKILNTHPIEFWFVGQEGIRLPDELQHNKRVHWVGPVPRSKTAQYFRESDLFIFPTLSDGFGLTQLEAMSYGMPVIASRQCGEVVDHECNGLVLPDTKATHIADVLAWCLENPDRLNGMSQQALHATRKYSSEQVFPALLNSIVAAV